MHPSRHDKAIYSLGIDPATTGMDEAAFIILEQKTYGDNSIRIVYRHTIEKCNTLDLRDFTLKLDKLFNFDKIYIDATGLGEGPRDMIMEKLGRKVTPIKFTNESKNDMFENLRILMLEGKIVFPATDRKLKKQLLCIRFDKISLDKKKIYHDPREHDDLVCALALAAIRFSRQEQPARRGYMVGRVKS